MNMVILCPFANGTTSQNICEEKWTTRGSRIEATHQNNGENDVDWQTIIRHYRIKHLPNHREETQWFAGQPTLADAIEKAAMAVNRCGKRYHHQCRIPHRILRASFQKLRHREEAIRACDSFTMLHNLVKATLKSISGVGKLYYYDTALRIGAKLNLYPETVLLHAGTKKGASFITDIRGKDSLGSDYLPFELRQLPAEQVEDILCIYKDRIKEIYNERSTG